MNATLLQTVMTYDVSDRPIFMSSLLSKIRRCGYANFATRSTHILCHSLQFYCQLNIPNISARKWKSEVRHYGYLAFIHKEIRFLHLLITWKGDKIDEMNTSFVKLIHYSYWEKKRLKVRRTLIMSYDDFVKILESLISGKCGIVWNFSVQAD